MKLILKVILQNGENILRDESNNRSAPNRPTPTPQHIIIIKESTSASLLHSLCFLSQSPCPDKALQGLSVDQLAFVKLTGKRNEVAIDY